MIRGQQHPSWAYWAAQKDEFDFDHCHTHDEKCAYYRKVPPRLFLVTMSYAPDIYYTEPVLASSFRMNPMDRG